MGPNPGAFKSSGSYIRAGRALFVMFVIALVVSAYIKFGIEGSRLNTLTLIETIGRATRLVALPILLIMPWRLIQRRRRKQRRWRNVTNTPIIIGSILFIVAAVLSLIGVSG